ncbi:MAG: hypothetical protein PHY55_02255 [Bacteroidales bacterium]|nr:hypothetical protein [Bacteroidales bacterium]
MKRIFFLLFILILFVSCSRKIEVFKKYDFNSGDYELYGIITMGTTTEFTEKVGEFRIKDITTLESMQSEWVLNTTDRRMLCGYSYDLYLMKADSCINQFSVNLECEYLTFDNVEEWYNFPAELLQKYEKSMIKLSKEESQEIREKINF